MDHNPYLVLQNLDPDIPQQSTSSTFAPHGDLRLERQMLQQKLQEQLHQNAHIHEQDFDSDKSDHDEEVPLIFSRHEDIHTTNPYHHERLPPLGARRTKTNAVQSDTDSDAPESLLIQVHENPAPFTQRRTGVSANDHVVGTSPLLNDAMPSHAARNAPIVVMNSSTITLNEMDNNAYRQGQLPSPLHHGSEVDLVLRERALQFWKAVEEHDVDTVLERIYEYYYGKGIKSMLLSQLSYLIILAFITSVSTFFFGCIDQTKLKSHKLLSEAIVSDCLYKLPVIPQLFLLAFAIYWIYLFLQLLASIPQLYNMHALYTQLLHIPETDLPTSSWSKVSERLFKLQDNPETRNGKKGLMNLDAHKLANRIMRKSNYWIALFNKDIFDLRVPLPLPLWMRDRMWLTKIMDWNLQRCIGDLVFTEPRSRYSSSYPQIALECDHVGVKGEVLALENRAMLVNQLRRRFVVYAGLNLILSPFIFFMTIMYLFLRYAKELHLSPQTLTKRRYSRLANQKFRDFNELPHFFEQRLNRSYPNAEKFISQFSSPVMSILANLIAFISGAFASILALLLVWEEEFDLGFQITAGRSIVFYITLFGGIFAVARGMVPDENIVLQPETFLMNWVEDTHYLPDTWKHSMHSETTRREFSELFAYRFQLLLDELISVVLAPLVLSLSLPQSADKVIDFFREFTVHVDGLGHVCSFAVFDFKKHGDPRYFSPVTKPQEMSLSVPPIPISIPVAMDEWKQSKYGKMEQSFVNFKINNPEWKVEQNDQSVVWDKLSDAVGNRMGIFPEQLRTQNRRLFPVTGPSRLMNYPRPRQVFHHENSQPQASDQLDFVGGGVFSTMNSMVGMD